MRLSRLALLLSAGLYIGLGATAFAAKKHPAPPPSPPMPVFSWTGFYVGGNVGYSFGRADTTYASTGLTAFGMPPSFSTRQWLDGVIGGVQFGYNWQAGPSWVYGLETDFQGSGQKGTGLFNRFSIMQAWYNDGMPYSQFVTNDGLHLNDFGQKCIGKLLSRAILNAVRPAQLTGEPKVRN